MSLQHCFSHLPRCIGIRIYRDRVPPRVGWDGVVAQILDSATDGERTILISPLLVYIICLKLLIVKIQTHSAEGVHQILEVSVG